MAKMRQDGFNLFYLMSFWTVTCPLFYPFSFTVRHLWVFFFSLSFEQHIQFWGRQSLFCLGGGSLFRCSIMQEESCVTSSLARSVCWACCKVLAFKGAFSVRGCSYLGTNLMTTGRVTKPKRRAMRLTCEKS